MSWSEHVPEKCNKSCQPGLRGFQIILREVSGNHWFLFIYKMKYSKHCGWLEKQDYLSQLETCYCAILLCFPYWFCSQMHRSILLLKVFPAFLPLPLEIQVKCSWIPQMIADFKAYKFYFKTYLPFHFCLCFCRLLLLFLISQMVLASVHCGLSHVEL